MSIEAGQQGSSGGRIGAPQHRTRTNPPAPRAESEYDVNQALVLVQMHNFCDGQLFLYRKLGMYHMLLQHYMEHDDFPNILETCQKFGDDDTNLWVQALTYFGARPDFPQQYIEQILAQVEERNLLPPLVVVQVLARNRKMPLSIVKTYITRRLRQERQQIDTDEREIRKLRDDTDKMRQEIDKLKARSVVSTAPRAAASSDATADAHPPALASPSRSLSCVRSARRRTEPRRASLRCSRAKTGRRTARSYTRSTI